MNYPRSWRMVAEARNETAGWTHVRLADIAHERNERSGAAPDVEVYSVIKYDGFVVARYKRLGEERSIDVSPSVSTGLAV